MGCQLFTRPLHGSISHLEVTDLKQEPVHRFYANTRPFDTGTRNEGFWLSQGTPGTKEDVTYS